MVRERCRLCHRRCPEGKVEHRIRVHGADKVRCPLCAEQHRGLDGLRSHMGHAHPKEPMTPHLRSCRDAAEVACLAVDPELWPYGWTREEASPLVGRLMATMRAHEMVPTVEADLNTTLDSTLNSTRDSVLDASFQHPTVRSRVVTMMPPAVEAVPSPQATDEDSLDWECEPSFQMGEEPLSCSSPLPSGIASSPVLVLSSVDQSCAPEEASLSGDLPGSPPDVEGMVPIPSKAPSGQVGRNLPDDHQEESPGESPGSSPQVTSSIVGDCLFGSQPGGDPRPHSPLLSQSLEAMAEDLLQEVQSTTSEYAPLLSESLEASLPPYVPTPQCGSSTTPTQSATDSSGLDTVRRPWEPKALPSDTEDPGMDTATLHKMYPAGFRERIPHGIYPCVPPACRDWTVAHIKLPVVPDGEPSLVWPPEGWALLDPKERLETHLHLAAILEAGWYGGDSQLTRWERHTKYRAFQLPGAAKPSMRGATELHRAQAFNQGHQRRLERMARRSGRWQDMPVQLRFPAELFEAYQLPQVLRGILDTVPQVPQPWVPRA